MKKSINYLKKDMEKQSYRSKIPFKKWYVKSEASFTFHIPNHYKFILDKPMYWALSNYTDFLTEPLYQRFFSLYRRFDTEYRLTDIFSTINFHLYTSARNPKRNVCPASHLTIFYLNFTTMLLNDCLSNI